MANPYEFDQRYGAQNRPADAGYFDSNYGYKARDEAKRTAQVPIIIKAASPSRHLLTETSWLTPVAQEPT
jgi:hypothetical protein